MASGLALIVYDDAAEAVKPSKSAFHDPALGDRYEAACGRWRPTRKLMLPAQGLYLLRKPSLVGLVCQYATQATSPGRTKLLTSRQ